MEGIDKATFKQIFEEHWEDFKIVYPLGATKPRTVQALRRIISLYEAWARADKAAEYRAMLPKPEGNSQASPP